MQTGRVLTSESRILTTHAGSLPRPPALAELHGRRSRGEAVDPDELRAAVEEATAAVIAAQVEAGIDVGNDGEQARESFFTYVQHRMTGFGGTSQRPLMRDLLEHPDFLELALPRRERMKVNLMAAPAAIGEVTYRDTGRARRRVRPRRRRAVRRDVHDRGVARDRRRGDGEPALRRRGRSTCGPSPPPSRTEYRAIVDRGLLLQIDAPDLAMERHTLFADRPLGEFLDWVELVVDAINAALDGHRPGRRPAPRLLGQLRGPAHPRRRPRRHPAAALRGARSARSCCRWPTPATPTSTAASSAARCPTAWSLVAGVIDTTSNYVEHPEVVADRLVRVAAAVGDPRRVIAGTDCGFDTSAGIGDVAPSLVWEKLRALRAGADLASDRLF